MRWSDRHPDSRLGISRDTVGPQALPERPAGHGTIGVAHMKRRIGVGVLLNTMLACASVVMLSCKSTPPAPEKLKVADGMKITVAYTITLPDQTVAASNAGREPLSYIRSEERRVGKECRL